MIKRNHFEMAAHDIQYRKKDRRSLPHTIETYTGNGGTDYLPTVLGVLGIVAFIITVFIVY